LNVNGLTEFDRTTRIIGPNVDFSTANIALGTANTLIAEITDIAHSVIDVSGTATPRGTLQLDFNGHVPQIGDGWDIIDAGSFVGNFASVGLAPGQNLDPGLGFIVSQSTGGLNGNVANVSLTNKLVLSVNRSTGDVSISNLSGAWIDFDGYEIGSVGGFLDDGSWNSLQSQTEPGWQSIGAPSANLVAELNSGSSSVLTGDQSSDLGSLSDFTPSSLGENGDDITFQYSLASGETIDGIIQYEGNQNNLVLVVDPTSGDSVLQN